MTSAIRVVPVPVTAPLACDTEPIHRSGAVQPHGVLLVADGIDGLVSHVSANGQSRLGMTPAEALGRPLASVLGDDAHRRLRERLETPRASGHDPLTLSLAPGGASESTWHASDGLLVLELEATADLAADRAPRVFEQVRLATKSLQADDGVAALCHSMAREVRALTGYDRAMVYRFHPDDHGEVVAEDVRDDLQPYLGLHYPASDIPPQARRLYLTNHLRVIVDVDYEPVPILTLGDEDATELDIGQANLRSVSPYHLAYLRNMGVGATLTISLLRGTRLWGMLACHHVQPRSPDAQTRAACRLLGQLFSLQLAAQEEREHAARRGRLTGIEQAVRAALSQQDVLAEALTLPEALALGGADGVVARIDGETRRRGAVPSADLLDALLVHASTELPAGPWAVEGLAEVLGEPVPQAAGALVLPLSGSWSDYVVWFRREWRHTLSWGGDPDQAFKGDPTAPIGSPARAAVQPRDSFSAWTQAVEARCQPWYPAELEAVASLGQAVPEILLARARDRLAHHALHDGLTSLPNRALLIDRAQQALAHRDRVVGEHVALLFVDLDHFKIVNDSLGHAAGDELLVEAARRLCATVRDSDTVARLGGDEFVVLCAGVSEDDAHELAERLVKAFRRPFDLEGGEALVTASVGVTVAEESATAAQLLRDADTAMYRVKHGGRDAAQPFTEAMREVKLRSVEIETKLRPALERRELELHYQPLFTVDGRLRGAEALSRWSLPGRGMVAPTEFIPIAERIGLTGPLTAWVLDAGLADLARWRRQASVLDLRISINVTAAEMTDPAFRETLSATLQRHGVPPSAVCLELTERVLIADDDLSQRFLGDLRELGVELSIDDFGTGFSSLAYLAHLPVNEVKIDRAFIRGVPERPAESTVVASVVGLAQQLGLRTVAEGVEREEQLAVVQRLGCDLVQGYLLGRPGPAAEMDRLLAAL